MSDFKNSLQTSNNGSDQNLQKVEESKAIAEIQASILMAKHSPRNEMQAYQSIIDSCKRNTLAENAMYAYPRGGTLVTGPSIRLAEVLARCWGNCRIGINIITQDAEKTEAKAYAYDMQTNYVVEQGFTVPHKRTTKRGVQRLTDERDIRELVSNIGSRILRGCILRLIPADIVEDAIDQVKKTLETSEAPMSDRIKRMVSAFDELGVKVEHIEKRLGHNLDALIATELVTLQGIYRSIKDGMSTREDYFEITGAAPKGQDALEEIKSILEEKND